MAKESSHCPDATTLPPPSSSYLLCGYNKAAHESKPIAQDGRPTPHPHDLDRARPVRELPQSWKCLPR